MGTSLSNTVVLGSIPPVARNVQEIREQLMAVFGENRLRVKLHAGERVLAVTQAHHGPAVGPGGNFQLGREASGLNHERVIATPYPTTKTSVLEGVSIWNPAQPL